MMLPAEIKLHDKAANPVKSADYDRMAGLYEPITRLISMGGNTRSQRYFLEHLAGRDSVLTVGCGSVGFNLDLARSGASVTALDISPRMLAEARKKIDAAGCGGRMAFVCADIMQYRSARPFDAILANFFLNTFSWEDCRKVLAHLCGQLAPGGLLCIADEARGEKPSTRALQGIFRPVLTWVHHVWADHPMHPIYDYAETLASLGMERVASRRDPSDYIISTVYLKPG